MEKQYLYSDKDGNLHDDIQAAGVLDISDLNRKQIKELAQNAAGWSGENGTFSWQDVASGQAEVQGKFTRHEDLFKRKFNKQLDKNLRHTSKMQEIENAKNGDVTALGRYQNYAKEDVAKTLAPLVAGVPMIGTGVMGTLVGGVSSAYANPVIRHGLNWIGTLDGIRNLASNNGINKTIRLAKEGDIYGAIGSGVVDTFDAVSMIDLPFSGTNLIMNPPKHRFKYVNNIGDGGMRWNTPNDIDVDLTYNRYVKNGIIKEEELPEWLLDKSNWKEKELDPYGSFSLDDDFNIVKEKIYSPSKEGKQIIVDHGRRVEDGLNFVDKSMKTRVPEQPFIFNPSTFDFKVRPNLQYHTPNFKLDFNKDLMESRKLYGGPVEIGYTPGTYNITSDGEIFTVGQVASHEGGHANELYNYRNRTDLFRNTSGMTDNEIRRMYQRLYPDSPEYHHDYSNIPEENKKLLSATTSVNDHDFELAEGYSDLWGTRYNMHDMNISSAALDPNKKYTYFDLLRYKMTPRGIGDRFIQQRGGWLKGWKQQLEALNTVYKKQGGKI